MSGPRLTAEEGEWIDRAVEQSRRANHVAWLRSTLSRFPFRHDLRDELERLGGAE